MRMPQLNWRYVLVMIDRHRLVLLLTVVCLAAASPGAEAADTATLVCGPLSPLVRGRPWVGPVSFGFYTWPANTTGRAHALLIEGRPTKDLVFRRRSSAYPRALTLRGFSCATVASLLVPRQRRPV